MKRQVMEWNEIDASELPVSPTVRVERTGGYGTVADLEEEEPIDAGELARMVAWQLYEPVLRLPGRGRYGRSAIDENGEIDWSRCGAARGRRVPASRHDHAQAWPARAQLKATLAEIGEMDRRIPGNAKYLVLKYLEMGILQEGHILNQDLLAMARLKKRAERLQSAIASRQGAQPRRLAPVLASVRGQSQA